MTEIPYGYCHCGCGQKTKIAPQTKSAYGWKKGEPMKYVNRHYARVQPRRSLEERFWEKVNKVDEEAHCWEWTAGTSKGYGRITIDSKQLWAHRISYELAYGSIPDGLWVLHKCDNPLCCNPTHLFLGTSSENTKDKVSKGRQTKGEACVHHKLTENQVREIRELNKTGKMSLSKIAKKYGISKHSAWRITSRRHWKHVE